MMGLRARAALRHVFLRSLVMVLSILPASFAAAETTSYTWLLSTIDAGSSDRGVSQVAAGRTNWPSTQATEGRWSVQLGRVRPVRPHHMSFGQADGTPITGDFNGDGYSEVGLFRDGQWLIDFNGNGSWDHDDLLIELGQRGDRPITGDWNQDGKTDIGVVGLRGAVDSARLAAEAGLPHPLNNGQGRIKNFGAHGQFTCTVQRGAYGETITRGVDHIFQFGQPGDEPVIGDWTGSGVATIGVLRDGQWLLDIDGDGRFTEADRTVELGNAGDLPVVGDFNGDGIDELGVYRQGDWIIDGDSKQLSLGGRSDRPVVGDWDGDGVDQIGVFHKTAELAAR